MKREFIEGKNYYEILENGYRVYYKDRNGYSYEYTRDELGNTLTYKDSNGYSYEWTRDELGNILTYKDSNGYSYEWTRDELGNVLTYTENGILIRDNRTKTKKMTVNEIIKELGYDIEIIKEETK